MKIFIRRITIALTLTMVLFATFWLHANGQIHLFAGTSLLSTKSVYEALHAPLFVEEGVGSWYGPGFHGRRTASGEIYDMHDFTAAHLTLPFGTILRVTNAQNGLSALVRVNDRGPYIGGRVIDLSYSAAKALDVYDGGTADLKLEVYKFPNGIGAEFVNGSTIGMLNVQPQSQISNVSRVFADRPALEAGDAIALNHDMEPVVIEAHKARVIHTTGCLRDALKSWKRLQQSYPNVVLLTNRITPEMIAAENECNRRRRSKRLSFRAAEPFQYKLATIKRSKLKLQEPIEGMGEEREPAGME